MIGKTISHYSIVEKIGSGGMGEVYRARDLALDREVALKILPKDIAEDPQRCERFEQEAKAIAALSHPNILAIYEFGSDQDHTFAAMELLEGETLDERLAEGPLQPRKAIELATQIADGLAAAHERGIVHRDIKPSNIFIMSNGNVKILDFGLARMVIEMPDLDHSKTLTTLTEPGVILGTVGYMSPEQIRGEPADGRSDIFSLGVLLYEMLTGSRPFEGSSAAEVMGSILRDDPTSFRNLGRRLPEGLDRIVQHCLEKRPKERFQSPRDLAFALTNEMTPNARELPPTAGPERGRSSRRPLLLWIAICGWLAAAVLLGLLQLHSPAPQTPVRMRTLTYSGRDWSPSSSPAGDMISFVSDRDGVAKIWLKQVAGGGEQALTEGPDDHPRFSPAGSQILFVRDRGGTRDLYRTSVVGGQPRKVLTDVLEADWSPDGSQIAFLRMIPIGEGNRIDVGVADVQSADERILTSVENRLCYGIRWSPDGRRLAVSEASLSGMVAGTFHIDLIEVTTGELERINLTDWSGAYTAIDWSPSGRSLLAGQATDVLAQPAGTPGQIMEYDLNSKKRRPLLWTRLQMPWGARGYSTNAVLNGSQILIDEHLIQENLREVAWTETYNSTPPRVLTSGMGRDRQPAHSPDGDRIVFSSNRSGNVDLWIFNRRTGDISQLTDDPANDWDPAFSPDGDHILWSSDRSGNMEIWMAAADGSRARQVSHDGVDAENPTMTPDKAWIVYASANDEKLGVWKIQPDGSDATLLAPGSYLIPEVSPDGRYALFVRHSGVNYVIHVVEIESRKVVPFEIGISPKNLNQNVMFGRARWTPNGEGIVYIGEDDAGRTGVFVQDFVPGTDTSESRRPLAGFSAEFVTETLGVAPDEKTIIISAMTEHRSLKLAEFASLKGWE
jgi:serine/threonine protein kinase